MEADLDVWFTDDPRAFLARAGALLAADPVTGSVVATSADRALRHALPAGLPDPWFAVVTDGTGEIAGIAARSAPYAPWPPYLLGMGAEAARALAGAVLARGYAVDAVSGLRPAADEFARTVAAATGRAAVVRLHHRLFRLGELVEPRPVPGCLRPVRAEEAALALAWTRRFFADADAQAGRPVGHHDEAGSFGIDDVRRKIADDTLWFWVDPADRPVHLVGAQPPSYDVVRIGPVYTPAAERGRGWAAAAVAEVARRVLARGERAVLFTDQANPASNRLYETLGFVPVADTVQLSMG